MSHVASGADGANGSDMAGWRQPKVWVADLGTTDQITAAVELLWRAWQAESSVAKYEVISASLLSALAHAGNYVSGAFWDGQLVGCCVGFFGAENGQPNHLHSHICGVAATGRDKGIGFALKRHQRRWALRRGIGTIRWTFDPLVRRNAYFNLCKLGATVRGYVRDFYGRLDDGINAGDRTDRLIVEWSLRSEQVVRAMEGIPFDAAEQARGVDEARLIAVPAHIERLRRGDPALARRLRHAVREEFQDLLAHGYQVVGMTRDGNYVLLPGASLTGSTSGGSAATGGW